MFRGFASLALSHHLGSPQIAQIDSFDLSKSMKELRRDLTSKLDSFHPFSLPQTLFETDRFRQTPLNLTRSVFRPTEDAPSHQNRHGTGGRRRDRFLGFEMSSSSS